MKTRGWMAGALVAVGGLVVPEAARAQDAVLVVRSAGELLDDVRYLVKSVAPEEQAGPVEGVVADLKERGLKGLDLSKPVGLMASLPKQPGEAPMIVAAVPTTDLPALLQSLQGLGVQSQPFEGEPGFSHQVMLPDGATTLFVTSASGYAYFSMVPQGAKELQALAPSGWAPKRPGAGDISLTVRMDRLPARIRQSVIDSVEQQMEDGQDRKPGESESDYQGRLAVMKLMGEAVTRFVRDVGLMALDLEIDQEGEEVSLALSVSGKTGTPMAKAIESFSGRKSRFANLGADAPMAGWVSVPVPEGFQDLMGKVVEEGRRQVMEEAEGDTEKQVADRIIDALRPTMTGDSLDLGLSMQVAEGGKPVMVGGMQVVDGKAVETALREALKKSPPKGVTKVAMDAAKAPDGTSIHKIQGKMAGETAKVFGEDSAMFLAFQKDVIFTAVGERGRQAVEKAIGESGKPAAGALPPVAFVLHASKMAPFFQARAGEEQDRDPKAVLKAVSEVFQGKNASKDLFRLSIHGQGQTVFLKMSCDVPLLTFLEKIGPARQDVRTVLPPTQ